MTLHPIVEKLVFNIVFIRISLYAALYKKNFSGFHRLYQAGKAKETLALSDELQFR